MGPEGPRLFLASSSPRRRELLGRFGVPFRILSPEVDESVLPGEAPEEHVRRLAEEKARAVAARLREGVVVSADTVVVLDGRILGKPSGPREAEEMFGSLAGRTHSVYSGVAVADAASGRVLTVAVRSLVTVAPVDAAEVRRYVATGEPLDKAGSYAVQGQGGRYVTAVEGSLTNVIGLPLRELRELLGQAGLEVPLPEGPL